MVKNIITSSTYQIRVINFQKSIKRFEKLLDRYADFVAKDDFYEWELFPNAWLQVKKGTPRKNSGSLRFGVKNITQKRNRLLNILNVEISEIEQGLTAAWCNFSDPDGNLYGLFQNLKKYPLIKD